jgi:NSS family neurotransmitter:Na+ symporter
MTTGKRGLWGSKVGFLLAAIGSAIGLGNIWRFSYMVHEYGGGAFLIPYFVALLVAGIPLMILEYTLGHRERASSPLAFARIRTGWEWIGWWMPIVALFGIMLYYSVVIGWCINYFFLAFNLSWGADTQSFFFNDFLQVSESPFVLGGIRIPILAATFVVWFLCWVICYREVNHGIEKACMIFMPMLFLLTLILIGWTLRLDGAWEAVRSHYLKADFTRLRDWRVWTAAVGQIFFTLSLGFGIMITYASYLPRKADIVGNALWTTLINCAYSFFAGFTVFGIVGFMAQSKGVPMDQVIKSGPQLAFVVYPEAIQNLPFARNAFGAVFFLVLIVAGLSSGISLIEAFTCALVDKFDWKRGTVVSAVCAMGFLGAIVFTTRAGLLILDIADHFITNYGLVFGGLLECLLVGWLLKAQVARAYVKHTGGVPLGWWWDVCVRYATPILLVLILAQALIAEIREAYGGYTQDQLIVFGVGWLMVTAVASVIMTFYPWKPAKLQHTHIPEEEHLLT